MLKTTKNNLFYLGGEFSLLKNSKVVVVPFGFEKSVSYGRGTSRGPAAIIQASQQVECYDEELAQETGKKIGIATLEKIKAEKSFFSARKQIQPIIGKILKNNKFPLTLGGEHSITPFIIETIKNFSQKEFSILQFDAHADLRDGYLGQKYSHAAAMRRCLDFSDVNLVQIGVRNISTENDELNFWEKNQNRIKTFWAKDKKDWKIPEILKSLKSNVYLTFDVDALDPSIMPSTGTPEPGGLGWYEVLDILRVVAKNKKIIGADFVEFAPIKNLHAPDFLVAKLIYKTIGFIFNK
jgi:agmatinase